MSSEPQLPPLAAQSDGAQPDATQARVAADRKAAKRAAREKHKAEKAAARPNTSVYVTGLPSSVTHDALENAFKKFGVLKRDVTTGDVKIKIYTEEEGGKPKGDALVTYLKPESVQLAVMMMDGVELLGQTIHVEPATYKPSDPSAAASRPKVKRSKDDARKLQQQYRQLEWGLDDERVVERKNKIVIIKHMFTPADCAADPTFCDELTRDVEAECGKIGPVAKVVVFDNNTEGAVSVRFETHEDAAKCIEKMNGRWFAQRTLSASWWDGVTDYRVRDSAAVVEKRLEEFGNWVESQEVPAELLVRTVPGVSSSAASHADTSGSAPRT